jgi:hypothetical protein
VKGSHSIEVEWRIECKAKRDLLVLSPREQVVKSGWFHRKGVYV